MDDDVRRPAHDRRLTGALARSLTTGCALVLLTTGLAAGPASAATDCAGAVRGDVNGDGHAEVVVGEPGYARGAGAVHVFYGSTAGLRATPAGTARDDEYVSQDTPGVPGTGEAGDHFGSSAVLADFDGDQCADLAVGAPGENTSRGAVTVLYGSPTGLSTARAASWTHDDLLGAGAGGPKGRFGETLAAGDLDGDGVADLAVGAPFDRVGGSSGGSVVVLRGGAAGLGGAGRTSAVSQATAGVPGTPEDGDGFGTALAVGDFDGDDVDDLAVGVDGENAGAGVVAVLPGRSGVGVGAGPALALGQASPRVPGAAEEGDRFGGALAAGDVTGDGHDDLAVGAPGENGVGPDRRSGAGSVTFLRGSATGITTTGSQGWTQDSPGVQGVAGPDDAFGSALAMGHLDGGPLLDLAVGAPRDAVGSVGRAGSVTVLDGSPAGLTTAESGGTRFHQDVDGLRGVPEPGDAFGWSVAAAPVQTPDLDSLVVGVPGESVGADRDGLVQQLSTFEFGPNPFGSRTLHQGTPGVRGTPADADAFGRAVR
ncbi:FG-GAP repeat-containing protein [Friedmanniella luteola]|uniref:FG-GAP repeat-containing protein n=1 Tax=Friedmanniella luteola TaxID=546871 RepID=A0A1H2AD62_9ACTN|nr:FG-GAP-like repeat-containing protein [Friedmanniella luteola]SDT43702.1 FG-GAP repeat-containing protein [Friedmanniella luteola]